MGRVPTWPKHILGCCQFRVQFALPEARWAGCPPELECAICHLRLRSGSGCQKPSGQGAHFILSASFGRENQTRISRMRSKWAGCPRFEKFMRSPPLLGSLSLSLTAGVTHIWFSQSLALALICLLLIMWMIYIPYRGGFRWTINSLEMLSQRRRGGASPTSGIQIPTRAQMLANVFGVLMCCGMVGYMAGGLAGAMKALIINAAILASIGCLSFAR